MKKDLILSLFDYSGNWSRPYKENGFRVLQIDIQHGVDILSWDYRCINKDSVYGILAAVPCTDFALSGARHFSRKDSDGTTQYSISLVKKTFEVIDYFQPFFWVIENPMSRIHKLCPELGEVKFKFNPCDFAGWLSDESARLKNQYNKTTWLWGKFVPPVTRPLPPLQKECPFWRCLGGNSLKVKNIRSETPLGFAYAFFASNSNYI